MYDAHDTIAAVSSAAGTDAVRTVLRVSGPQAFEIVGKLFETDPAAALHLGRVTRLANICIDKDLSINTMVYVFPSPHSYTGDDLIELHICAPPVLIEAVMQKLFALDARSAGPGEFTARAYLNGKLDLAQAEAVAQIIAGSNLLQLTAAQKLLAGRLTQTIRQIQNKLIDLISRIEAGLDFAGEDVEFISTAEAIGHIDDAIATLRQLLAGSVHCEEMIALPSVGIVGASNAGKSSLINALLGHQRSIVSQQHATTRDVLTGLLKLPHCNCAVFDCAGLLPQTIFKNILGQLAQDAAIEAVQSAQLIIFCVDVSKSSWSEDREIFKLLRGKSLIGAATKCDILQQSILPKKIADMKTAFGLDFLTTSSTTAGGTALLLAAIDTNLTSPAKIAAETADVISLNQRHRQWLENAIDYLQQAKGEILSDNEEVAAMLLRNAYRTFGELSDEEIDETVLERIFSRFCIGK